MYFFLLSLLFVLLAVVGENDLQCCVIFLTATSRGNPAAGCEDLCCTLIEPCSAKIVVVAFLPVFFSLFSPYLITAGRLPCNPLCCSPRSQQIVSHPLQQVEQKEEKGGKIHIIHHITYTQKHLI
jgi:hypothetical protein